ncbi:unnamed protein product [Mesocestoides corti]|uniref:Uncharacterized protein n=1 Tax=Mesocestoides corti TaxID=53468 RepID=A0A0R3UCA5_MESCO|nr:unnamed protein product [Mesocestoides corti]
MQAPPQSDKQYLPTPVLVSLSCEENSPSRMSSMRLAVIRSTAMLMHISANPTSGPTYDPLTITPTVSSVDRPPVLSDEQAFHHQDLE